MTSSEEFGSTYLAAENAPNPGYPPVGYPAKGGYAPGSYLPSPVVGYGTDAASEEPESPSTADVAKDQVASVAGGAADAAQHVAGVAKEQVGQVTAEAGRQATQLLGQAQSELVDQATVQQQRAASGLHALAGQLHDMAEGSKTQGVATDVARQGADKARQFATWLEDRDPGSVLNELRSFARQRPGAFLGIALGAGLVAGRLARGLSADPEKLTGSSAGKAVAGGTTNPADQWGESR